MLFIRWRGPPLGGSAESGGFVDALIGRMRRSPRSGSLRAER